MMNKPYTESTMETSMKSLACSDCGSVLVVQDSETGLVNPHRLVLVCDSCAEKRDLARLAGERHAELKRRFSGAVARGLVTDSVREARFAGLNPDITARNANAWEMARKMDPANHPPNVFLFGNPGTGKTLLSRCVLRRAFVSGFNVAETNGRRLMKTASRFDEGHGIFEEWKNADVLLLDDVDKTHASRDGVDALWELLDSRCNGRRLTLVTANRKIGGLVEHLSAGNDGTTVRAALDRLSPLTQLEMVGESLR